MNKDFSIVAWIDKIREDAALRVIEIPFSESQQWSFRDGILKHKTGRFFQVAGVRWSRLHEPCVEMPLLVQKEIGTLGFAVQGGKILVQAKVEPGNVGEIQIAPTCQATKSNLGRVHGGAEPAFSKLATDNLGILHDSRQSEQGTRFFHKFNRNILCSVGKSMEATRFHRWVYTDELLALTGCDYLVNTDARSVLVCSPWKHLVNRKPFSRNRSRFSADLARSLSLQIEGDMIIKSLITARVNFQMPILVPLEQLDGWKVGSKTIASHTGGPFEIRQIRVEVNGREVSSWDQPILKSVSEGLIELVCGRREDSLYFLFSIQTEAGLKNGAELGPSFINESRRCASIGGDVLAECRQSDEGGRFLRDVSIYRLVDLGEIPESLCEGVWLTLGQVQKLLGCGGWFTNEARSALSLLLPWL